MTQDKLDVYEDEINKTEDEIQRLRSETMSKRNEATILRMNMFLEEAREEKRGLTSMNTMAKIHTTPAPGLSDIERMKVTLSRYSLSEQPQDRKPGYVL